MSRKCCLCWKCNFLATIKHCYKDTTVVYINQKQHTLSKYLGRSVAMVSAVAGETSDGLMMTQLPAAMAPVAKEDGREWWVCVMVARKSGNLRLLIF